MLLNDRLRQQIKEQEIQIQALQAQLASAKTVATSPRSQPWRDRLREAINTEKPNILVSNDDCFQALKEITRLERLLAINNS